MTILILGATGATGSLLTTQLLESGHQVKAIVRSPDKLKDLQNKYKSLTLIEGAVLDFCDDELESFVKDCDAVASCLGHNISMKGIYGKPRKLVTDAAKRLCKAIKANGIEKPTKYVLMNTSGNRNRDLQEPLSFGHKVVVGLLRLLLPPHVDNENAADFLRVQIGQDNAFVEWVAVRPDNLIDQDKVSEYEVYPSPIRDPIFSAGKTSRINVGNFMAELITDEALWNKWKGQMPLIYNKENQEV